MVSLKDLRRINGLPKCVYCSKQVSAGNICIECMIKKTREKGDRKWKT